MAAKRRPPKAQGALIIIGGHEDKSGEMCILKEVVVRAKGKPVVVASLASSVAGEIWTDYRRAFRHLGVKDVLHFEVERRDAAHDRKNVKMLESAGAVFITGGDQLRITSKLGGTDCSEAIRHVFAQGGVIAGTSAGASVMSETMLVSGPSDESMRVRDAIHMAPGLGFIRNVVIDQHFAQRGRIGRLLAVVGQNPRMLGVGIDEDTAIVVSGSRFQVIGTNAVYVADGREISHSNLYEAAGEHTISLADVRLHVLSEGDAFDLKERRPHLKGADG